MIEHLQEYSIPKERIGESKVANNGLLMSIIGYRNANDIDVQFEDGTIVHNKQYSQFAIGAIKNPNSSKKHVGEININNQNEKMKIITYRNYDDIDIEFEDKTIVKHRSIDEFKLGKIKNPNHYIVERVGESNTAPNGMKMTIIAYRGYHDIDVQFEDGTIVYNRDYNSFKKRKIGYIDSFSNLRIGETITTYEGHKIKLIKYDNVKHIVVLFENIFEKRTEYKKFKTGKIKFPFPQTLNNIEIQKNAYVHNGIGHFFCKCKRCHMTDIMSISEIKEHNCYSKNSIMIEESTI